MLSSRPLSTDAAERRLETRFTSLRDDDSAAAGCSARQRGPDFSFRRCRILYPSGAARAVIVLTDARGRELLIEPQWLDASPERALEKPGRSY
jgi:hypothetical protein